MTRVVSFPALGLEFALPRILVSFGPFTVHWYGLIVVTGIALGVLSADRKSVSFGIHPDRLLDACITCVAVGYAGARLYYVAFSWEMFRSNPISILYIWEGGIGLYGGILTAFALVYLLCRRWNIPFFRAADLGVGGIILAQAVGRWGNFFNMEAFGTNTTLPWGMTGTDIVSFLTYHQGRLAGLGVTVDPLLPVHPTFLYESLWNLAGFGLIVWYTNRRRFNGELLMLYWGWYGIGRFWIEGLRTDSLMLGAVRVSQMVAAVTVLASAAAWCALSARYKKGTLPRGLVIPDAETLRREVAAQAPPDPKGQPKEQPAPQDPAGARTVPYNIEIAPDDE